MVHGSSILLFALAAGAAPFANVAEVPHDVQMYVQVDDVAEIFRSIHDRPIAQWCGQFFDGGKVRKAWSVLAQQGDLNSQQLFDRAFSGSVTLITRRAPLLAPDSQEHPSEWVVIAHTESSFVDELIQRLKPRLLLPRRGYSMLQLPEHGLIIARRESVLLTSPIGRTGLLNDVLALRQSSQPGDSSLAALPAFTQTPQLGDGQISVFMRHEKPMGGWSAAVAKLDGDRVKLRHMARFDSAPFSTPITTQTWDIAAFEVLGARAIAVFIEPPGDGQGRAERLVHRSLGRAPLSIEAQQQVGAMAIVLNDDDGRLREDPIDGVGPALAICYQLRDGHIERETLDRDIRDLVQRAHHVLKIDAPAPVPDVLPDPTGASINITPLAKALLADSPITDNFSLYWGQVCRPHGNWWVISTNRDQFRDVCGALRDQNPEMAADPQLGQWAGGGLVNGRQLAVLLRKMADRPLWPIEEDDAPRFAATLETLANLADGVERCSWRLRRPKTNSMLLEIDLTLSPPESAAAGPSH